MTAEKDTGQSKMSLSRDTGQLLRMSLNSEGTCLTCDKKADTEYMSCFSCDDKFHVFNCTLPDLCTQSFIKNTWINLKKNWPNIMFVCPDCKESKTLNRETVVSNRLACMEESVRKVSQEMKSIRELLSQPPGVKTVVLDNQDYPQRTCVPTSNLNEQKATYAQKAQTSVIIVKKGNQELSQEDEISATERVKQAAIRNSAAVMKTYKNGVGSTVFVCENEKSKQTLLPHLTKEFPGQTIITPLARQPTVTIVGIHGEYKADELFDVIKEQNVDRGIKISKENFRVLFTKKMNNESGLYTAVVRVSEDIRDSLKVNRDRVCIGLNSCPVYDRFFVKRCNKCQNYGHFHRDCPNSVTICAKCSETHETNECNIKVYKCFNCTQASISDSRHPTFSSRCPCYVAEQEKVKNTINYYSKN